MRKVRIARTEKAGPPPATRLAVGLAAAAVSAVLTWVAVASVVPPVPPVLRWVLIGGIFFLVLGTASALLRALLLGE